MVVCVPLGCSTWSVNPLFNIGEWSFPDFAGDWNDNRRQNMCDICVTHVFIFSVTNKENDSAGYVCFLQRTVQSQS